MSYADPAPFQSLLHIADGIKASVAALQKHPEGAKAFEAWIDEIDFHDRYGTRYKDLPVDKNVPEALVLVEDSFEVDAEGNLWCASGYTNYQWIKGRWVSENEELDEEEDDEDEDE